MQKILLLIIIALISALSALVSKLLVQDMSEGIVVFLRYFLALLFMLPWYKSIF
jgi:drug/metabolite transporter (DMT)-like permease